MQLKLQLAADNVWHVTNTTAACNPLSSWGGLNYFPVYLNKTQRGKDAGEALMTTVIILKNYFPTYNNVSAQTCLLCTEPL